MSSLRQLVGNLLASNGTAGLASRFITLSTQGVDGAPRIRTMVFRGFDPDSEAVRLFTDARSEKMKELCLSDRVELCWYFAETWEQLRITGKCQVSTNNSETLFRTELSDETRRSYGLDLPSSSQTPTLVAEKVGSTLDQSDPWYQKALGNFRVLLVHPDRVIHLRLKQRTADEFQL